MAYRPTHRVPPGGLHAFRKPDPSKPPRATLAAGLDVQVLDTRDDWARIACSNGWKGWVDRRRLQPWSGAGAAAAAAAAAPTPTIAPDRPAAPRPPAAAPTWAGVAGDTEVMPQGIAPVAPSAGGGRGIASGTSLPQLVVLLGATLIGTATLLDWIRVGRSANAYDVSVEFLVRGAEGLDGSFELGVAMLMLAVLSLCAIAAPLRVVGVVTGLVAFGASAFFVFRVWELWDDSQVFLAASFGFDDAVGIGPFLAALGGFIVLLGAWLPRSAR